MGFALLAHAPGAMAQAWPFTFANSLPPPKGDPRRWQQLVNACQAEIAAANASSRDSNGASLNDASLAVINALALDPKGDGIKAYVKGAEDQIPLDLAIGQSGGPNAAVRLNAIPGDKAAVCIFRARASGLGEVTSAPQPQQSQVAMNAPSNGGGNNSSSNANNSSSNASNSNTASDSKPKSKTPGIAEMANHCVALVKDPNLYGGFKNSCAYPISISWCAYHPNKGAWSEAFDCDHDVQGIGRGGLSTVGANQIDGTHTNNAEKIFWFACRRPAYPIVTYTSGVGFYGYCK